jgi:sodium/potassium/calcium exchanger 6
MYYCDFPSGSVWRVLSGLFLVLWCGLLFYLMADTADEYLVPSLTVLSEMMHLSPNVAGVTLLAAANGAPDMFSAIAAFSGESTSADLGTGLIFGGGIFITTCVFGAVAFVAPFTLNRRPFIRDIVFYVVGTVLFYYFTLDGEISLLESCLLFALYVVYVIVVVVGRRIYQNYLKPQQEGLLGADALESLPSVDGDLAETIEVDSAGMLRRSLSSVRSTSSTHTLEASFGNKNYLKTVEKKRRRTDSLSSTKEDTMLEFAPLTNSIVLGANSELVKLLSDDSPLFAPSTTISHKIKLRADSEAAESKQQEDLESLGRELESPQQEPEQESSKPDYSQMSFLGALWANWKYDMQAFHDRNVLGKLVFVFEVPFILARKASVPMIEEHSWNHSWATVSCLCAPVFALVAFGLDHPIALIIAAVAGVILAGLVFKLTTSEFPQGGMLWLLVIVSFTLGCAWTMIIADEVVGLLVFFGELFEVGEDILGATVLTWGNSLGDLVANIAVAKNGNPKMAAAGCFGGPLFNQLVGGGVAFIVGSLENGGKLVVSATQELNYYGLLAALGLSLIAVPVVQFRVTRRLGMTLCVAYLVYLAMLLLGY